MFKGRLSKVEIDYIPPSAKPTSHTRLSLKGVDGSVLENDAYIRSVTGLESEGYETLGGSLAVGGSAYTGTRATDREVVFTLECAGGESDFRNKVNNLKLLQADGPLYFRVTSTEGSALHTYGYLTELAAPLFRKEREIQLTFKSPSPYFIEKPITNEQTNITETRFADPQEYQLPENRSDFASYTAKRFRINFDPRDISQKSEIKLVVDSYTDMLGYSFVSGGRVVNRIASLKGTQGTSGGKVYYDSMEGRINNHSYISEGMGYNTPIDAPDLTDYGEPKKGGDMAAILRYDWRIAYSTPSLPTPNFVAPYINVIGYDEGNVTPPRINTRAVIYNKVLGV